MSRVLMYDLFTKLHKKGAFSEETAVTPEVAFSLAKQCRYKFPSNAIYTLQQSGYLARNFERKVWLSPLSIEMLKAYGYSIPTIKNTPVSHTRKNVEQAIDEVMDELESEEQKHATPKQGVLDFAPTPVTIEADNLVWTRVSVGNTILDFQLPSAEAEDLLRVAITKLTLHRPSSHDGV